ncbi:MAG: 6-carboxytetrahydropterin synthase QueD [Phycisphaerae bacterium]|nr:6-carboxytetrahydropterin synthase QueD [Phycisphaerae bacterium]
MKVHLTKSFRFEAAHWLPTFPEDHKCRRLHGHSFHVDVVVSGEVPEQRGYLVDYGEIKQAVEPVCDRLDHRCLNDIDGLENPTAEHIARWIWDQLQAGLPLLHCIRVHETCTTACEYHGG